MKDSEPDHPLEEFEDLGLRNFDFKNLPDTPAGCVFLQLWPGSIDKQLQYLNRRIKVDNHKAPRSKRDVKLVTELEFMHFIAILILASCYEDRGRNLWQDKGYDSYTTCPNIKSLTKMSYNRFNDIKNVFVYAFSDMDKNTSNDPWFLVRELISDFGLNRKKNIAASISKTLDESMSAYKPRTTKTGNLPNISFVKRKPKPLGSS